MPNGVTLSPQARGTLTVYPVESARALGVDSFVTDRFGGVSSPPYHSLNLGGHVGDRDEDVQENRQRVARAIGVEPTRLVIVRQIHGGRVLDAASVTVTSEADALVSDSPDVALAILVADCVPILLVDATSARFALVHAGWRGLEASVIAHALMHFSDAANVHAFLGPSISLEAYQVGPDVAQHFDHVPGALTPDGGDRSRLDLRRVVEHQLLECGVRATSIERSRQVTDGGELFFSDRAERPCGRFALVAKRVS